MTSTILPSPSEASVQLGALTTACISHYLRHLDAQPPAHSRHRTRNLSAQEHGRQERLAMRVAQTTEHSDDKEENTLLPTARSAALARDSARFMQTLASLWRQAGITPQDVAAELDGRINLSDKLLARGIRARKGGRYRTTKLP
ncbi:hypothetical protein E3E12_05590 [Formicincola oecophyllae]|uniref:Uncharacterized protein n=1 Tax=Formicincola oecophyllae TaxID=2558361 RepID=A0A4Y6U965_9PROT|nr:hypothetical protein [Formicincola oecophyllae]QDH13744.1 hypothetical protein E3E12_05590 [Formicincola oecophyllae]